MQASLQVPIVMEKASLQDPYCLLIMKQTNQHSQAPNIVAFSPNTGCFLQPLVAYCNEPYHHTAE